MGRLHWVSGTESRPWTVGSARIRFDEEHPAGTLPVAVRCRFGSLPTVSAMLDTGAAWTVLDAGLTERLGDELGEPVGSVLMSTRLGLFEGTLHRLPIHFVADEGSNLVMDATCLALKEWPGPSILGFSGCLDRIRFALEPETADHNAHLHFGQE